jgi:HAD superfamily hydrolase (TIGR01450 family)
VTGTLLEAHDALLVDLDGVVDRGAVAVPHAVEALRAARTGGSTVAYVTNNASRPPAEVAAHLRELGLDVADDDVVTSAQAAAREVAARVPAGARVLAIGGLGVAEALRARGLEVVDRATDDPVAVVMGFGPDVSGRALAEASYAVAAGALFVASNTDASIPTARGIAPGNGTLVGAVASTTGREPLVAGKPFAPLMQESIERVGARRPLVIGDRLDTDVEAGYVSGIPSLLVMTGVTDVGALLDARPEHRPTYVAADLRGLRSAVAALPVIDASPDRAAIDGLDPLRAACARSWSARDAGAPSPVSADERTALAEAVSAALG